MFWKRKNKKTETDELLILFGTRSGNSRFVAKQAEQFFRKNGMKACCMNMSKYNPQLLPEVKKLLAVVSTHGEGEPPEPARKFFHRMKQTSMGKLTNLQYSVCALGDSSYEQFCRAGKDLDEQLNRLGADPVLPCMECDVDFSKDAVKWIQESYRVFSTGNGHQAKDHEKLTLKEKTNVRPQFQAKVIDKKKLSGESAHLPVYHISLKVDNDKFNYKPGDSIEIFPRNPEWLVDKILKLVLNKHTKNGIADTGLKSFLLEKAEITRLNAGGIRRYQKFTNSTSLQHLIDDNQAFTEYLNQANLLDLLIDFPNSITAEQLKTIPPSLSPRVYSIASGPAQNPAVIDLVVKTIRYQYKNLPHEGAGSVFVTEELQPGSIVNFSLEKNPAFRLPDNPATPIIMIGVGTGIAPFRSFLQERSAHGIRKGTWLIWGSKNQAGDSLYNSELETFLEDQILERMDTVFSRDGHPRKYVQDILTDKNNDLVTWLEMGAHIYVCGSIAMGKGVKSCMNHLLENTPFRSVENLRDINRYHADVY